MASVRILDEVDKTELQEQIDKRAKLTDLANPYNLKGSLTFDELPTTGNKPNDTYFCTDKHCNYTWNGTEWFQSSVDEFSFEGELIALKAQFELLSEEFKEVSGKVVQGDYLQNDETQADYIKHRPFYEGTVTYVSWDGSVDGLESKTVGDVTYYKLSDTPLTADDLDGAVYEVKDTDGNVVDSITLAKEELMCDEVMVSIYTIVSFTSDFTLDGDTFTAGVWTVKADDGSHLSSLTKYVIVQLDEKFVPDAVYKKVEEMITEEIPEVTADDNDKVMQVVGGEWVAVTLEESAVKTYIDTYINEALGGEY